MRHKNQQVFCVEGVCLETWIGQSPWVCGDFLMIPVCSWETIMELLQKNHHDKYNQLGDFLYSENQDVWILKNVLIGLQNIDVYHPSYQKIIQKRIEQKQDMNFELSEFQRMLRHICALLQLVYDKKYSLETWID